MRDNDLGQMMFLPKEMSIFLVVDSFNGPSTCDKPYFGREVSCRLEHVKTWKGQARRKPTTGELSFSSLGDWTLSMFHDRRFLGTVPRDYFGRGHSECCEHMMDGFACVRGKVDEIGSDILADPRTPRVTRNYGQ